MSDRNFCIPSKLFLAVLVIFAAIFTGCSGTPAGPQADGQVLLDGTPQSQLLLKFYPVAEGSSAFATSDSDGNFQVSTTASESGLPEGEYVVVVERAGDESGEGEADVSGLSPIPAKYKSVDTSDLKIKVAPGQENTFKLEMTSAP